MVQFRHLTAAFLALAGALWFAPPVARAAPFHGIAYQVSQVCAGDGAELLLFELKGNEEGPVILLEPGLVETAETLDGIAAAYHRRGYKVFIGQVRLAGRGADRSGGATRNGLEEVLLQDFPAHLREVVRRSPGRKIHVLGHSMGGMEILATFSDPRLSEELAPHVEAVTLLAAPHELGGLPWKLRAEARVMLPVFRATRAILGKASLGPHHTVFDFTRRLKESRNPVLVRSARAVEGWIIRFGTFMLNRMLIDVNHTSPEALRRLWFKELSALPLDLLIDFAEAALKGKFVGRDGRPLIVPERFALPAQVVRAEHDLLVPWDKQEGLFARLGSGVKRLVSLRGMFHVDPAIADRPHADFLGATVDFHDRPAEIAASQGHVLFRPDARVSCEKFLVLATP